MTDNACSLSRRAALQAAGALIIAPVLPTAALASGRAKGVPAGEALARLKEGNRAYVSTGRNSGDISRGRREATARDGQSPYAVIISCADSRSIPETVFSSGIGDLFVIRVAGNVILESQLGSIEYAVDHLGVNLVVVLGHTGCGAVDSAMHSKPEGHAKTLTDKVLEAIGSEEDATRASGLNARYGADAVRRSLGGGRPNLSVTAAVHNIKTGEVEFL